MSGGAGLFGVARPVGVLRRLHRRGRSPRSCGGATSSRRRTSGDHTPVVQLHLRYGMILFIASEVMFFVAWFWAYFDAALFPAGVHDLAERRPTSSAWSRATS